VKTLCGLNGVVDRYGPYGRQALLAISKEGVPNSGDIGLLVIRPEGIGSPPPR